LGSAGAPCGIHAVVFVRLAPGRRGRVLDTTEFSCDVYFSQRNYKGNKKKKALKYVKKPSNKATINSTSERDEAACGCKKIRSTVLCIIFFFKQKTAYEIFT